MGVNERDPHTGQITTGHEWNGIKELNTGVPKAVWYFLGATFLFSLIYWILMPTWPLGGTYTKGLLGADVRRDVAENLADDAANRSVWTSRVEKEDFDAILGDNQLMRYVREAGHRLYGDNCAACHGSQATGAPGFPNLVDKKWLWGGSPQAVFETIRVGINSDNPKTHVSQMLAFGREGVLNAAAIDNVVSYVRSLSHPVIASGAEADKVAAGQQVFAANCSACHGTDGKGKQDVGAPDLTDNIWLYGGDENSIRRTIYGGRQGHMPTWEGRLAEIDRKILTLYVIDKGRSAP